MSNAGPESTVPPAASGDPGGGLRPPGGGAGEGREEELLEEIRKIKVADFVLSAVATLGQLAYSKLEPSTRDLDQARLAIEGVRALVPTLEGAVPAQTVSDYGQLVANLQLAYVAALKESPQKEAEQEQEQEPAPEDAAG